MFIINYIKTNNPNVDDAEEEFNRIINEHKIDLKNDLWVTNVFKIIYNEGKDKFKYNSLQSKITHYVNLITGETGFNILQDLQTGMERTLQDVKDKMQIEANEYYKIQTRRIFDKIKKDGKNHKRWCKYLLFRIYNFLY